MIWFCKFLIVLSATAYGAAAVASPWIMRRRCSPALWQSAFRFGLLAHTLAIAWLLASAWRRGAVPLSGLDAALLLAGWGMAAVLVFCGRRREWPPVAAALLPLVMAMQLGAVWAGGKGALLAPLLAQQQLFFVLHAAALSLALGVLCSALALSFLYLWQHRALQRRPLGGGYRALPPLETLERGQRFCQGAGFVLLLLGTVSGLILAHYRWLGFWAADPVVLFTLLALFWYGLLLLLQSAFGWRARRGAWLALLGFALLLFTIAGILFWFPKGRHPVLEISCNTNTYKNLLT